LHNHHQNTLKPRFMTILVFRWNSWGLSKCLESSTRPNLKIDVHTCMAIAINCQHHH